MRRCHTRGWTTASGSNALPGADSVDTPRPGPGVGSGPGAGKVTRAMVSTPRVSEDRVFEDRVSEGRASDDEASDGGVAVSDPWSSAASVSGGPVTVDSVMTLDLHLE